MAEDVLNYDRMVEDALRGVVRDAIGRAVAFGLPGEHHFYVTFDTRRPGVGLADHLRARHPEEMTIVLQHQFWDLSLDDDDAFLVSLSFSGKTERLRVPFGAITGFADPSAKFGLQFQVAEADGQPAPVSESAPEAEDGEPSAPPSAEGGNVVTLDAFRKK